MLHADINTVLCDMNGLFRIWNDAGAREAESEARLPAGTVNRYAYQHPSYRLARVGILTDDQWAADVATRIARDHGQGAAAALARWRADRGTPVPEMIRLLGELRRLVPVGVLSNCTDRLPADLALHGIEFDHVFSSASLGVDKPSPHAFRLALEAMNAVPRHTIYIDDEPAFVTAAAHTGLNAYLFQRPSGFAEILAAHGLALPEAEPAR